MTITPQAMAAMREEYLLIKEAEITPVGGAAMGSALLGPLGAGIGATMAKRRDRKYSGSPGWRAFGGGIGGNLLGAMAMAPAGLPAMMMGGAIGGILGAAAGAGSVESSRRKFKPRRKFRRK